MVPDKIDNIFLIIHHDKKEAKSSLCVCEKIVNCWTFLPGKGLNQMYFSLAVKSQIQKFEKFCFSILFATARIEARDGTNTAPLNTLVIAMEDIRTCKTFSPRKKVSHSRDSW